MQKAILEKVPEVSAEDALGHLQVLLGSPFFSSSKRCRDFLRYIVLETVHGRGDLISERNIAYEVFGKGTDFEPGEDSLVRVKAREVRKRLADYYESTPESQFKIDIPLGGYVPQIHPAHDPVAPMPDVNEAGSGSAKRFDRRRFGWLLGGAAAVTGAALTYPLIHGRHAPLDLLWRPIFATKTPLLIFVPLFTDKATGMLTDRVGLGPAATLSSAADFLGRHNYPYYVRFGSELTFSQLREQPSLILGGFSSIWTLRMTRNLRFTLIDIYESRQQVNAAGDQAASGSHDAGVVHEQAVIDKQTKQVWKPVNRTANGFADQDYGIACRLFDEESGQIVLIAAGVTTFGTEGAASMFFDPAVLASALKKAPGNWETKNFQAVIHVSIVGTTPSIPEVVTTHFW